jgi:transcription elongation factor Elf1
MSQSEPIPFRCPSCEAEYKIVTIETDDVVRGTIRCLKCDALFPAGEGRVAFKYLLVGPSGRNRRRK